MRRIIRDLFGAVLVVLLCSYFCYAQKFNIQSYSVNDGLPASTIIDVQSDHQGYLWYATPVGIVRYDGKNYKTYTEENGLKDALSYLVFVDNGGDVWAGTEFGGLAKFEHEKFVYPQQLQNLDTTVVSFVAESGSEFWIATESAGVIIWDRGTNSFDTLNVEKGLPHNQVWDVHFSSGDIWISTMGGIVKYKREEGVVEVYTINDGLSGDFAYQAVTDDDGNIWVATSNGITVYREPNQLQTITEIDGVQLDYVYVIEKGDDGSIWIGTERKGIFIYKNGEFRQVKKNNGLSSNFVYRFKPDPTGFMWIATDGNGVNAFRDMNFESYDSDTPLKKNHVFSMLMGTNNTIWLGTEEGIFNYKNGEFKQYIIPESLLNSDAIWGISEFPDGRLLLENSAFGVIEFDGEQFYEPDFFSMLPDEYVYDVMIDGDGSVWVAVFGYLNHYKNGMIESFRTPSDFYWQQSINFMYRDSSGILWVGTEAGVATFIDGEFAYYTEEDGVVGKSIYELVEDQQGNLWIGSSTGISFASRSSIDAGSPTFTDFFSDKLYNRETIFLQFDAYGGLWQGTNNGLNYLNVRTSLESGMLSQVHFPLSNTELGTEFHGAARGIDEQGKLWFGTDTKGLVSYTFDNDSGYVHVPSAPQVFLREIYSNNTLIYSQLEDSVPIPQRKIAYDENDLVFRFNAIDYLNPKGIYVKYRLAGYDTEWQEAYDISEIRYTNVPWGKFELQVAAKSVKSVESDVYTLASIIVKKPFYLSIPFFGILLVFAFVLILVWVNHRVSKIEKKELQILVDTQTAELTKALNEKEVLIKEIHHRVKNNLAVVSGLLELQGFRMPPGEPKQAILESKMRVIAISKIHENLYQNHDLANVDFRKFINELIKSVQVALNLIGKDIQVVQYIDEIYLDVNVGVPLALIINELVNNCFKHAFNEQLEGTVTISFNEQPDIYMLSVSDDGVGSQENILEKKTKSLGITLIKSLCTQLDGTVTYKYANGSTFTLIIPKQKGKSEASKK